LVLGERKKKSSSTLFETYILLLLPGRKCVGQNFGDKIVKTIVCGLMENYHVELKDNYITEDHTKFVNAPSGMLIFTPRK
jgi:hypothetical protein